ncbi:MAG: DUF3592 domain-containing protein [Gemmataceae bacterium]|nr:DUF3592 domain-containing protein [Gemmataceae bacterium]
MSSYDPTMAPPRTIRQMLVYGAFWSFFLVIGLFIAWFGLWFLWWPQWRMNNVYVETDGVILDKRIVPTEMELLRQVRVRYHVGDRELVNWSGRCAFPELPDFETIKIGSQRSVWYDPANPNDVIVERGYAVLTVLLYPMLAVGLFFAVYAGVYLASGVTAWLSAK